MGRIATAAIIALAFTGAAVESHAGNMPTASPGPAQAAAPAAPVAQLLADASSGSTSGSMPALGAPPPGAPMAGMPPGAPPPGAPLGPRPGMPPGPMGWAGPHGMHQGPQEAMWRLHHMMKTWGLFYDQRDKNLSDGDVQTLAAAILLVHGNHSWKVVDVADAADGHATFAYATADGSVIARFSIDRETGRIARIG